MFEKFWHRVSEKRSCHPNSVDYMVFVSAVAVFVYSFFLQGYHVAGGMVRYPLSVFVSGFVAVSWFFLFIIKIGVDDV